MPTQAAFVSKNYTEPGNENREPQLDDLYLFIGPWKVSLVVARKSNEQLTTLRIIESPDGSFLKDAAALREALESLHVQKEFSTFRVITDHEHHIFVPEALFVGEKAVSYLNLSFAQAADQKIISNRLSQKNMVSVFAVPDPIYSVIMKLFPDAVVSHLKELLLDIMLSFKVRHDTDRIFLFIRQHTFDIGHMKNGSLHFLNSFPHEADTDIIFFLLSVMEALKLNPEKTTVMISGDIHPNSTLPALLKKYIPLAELMKRPDKFYYPASFREFAGHQHYLEICSLLCES